jgi:superoxide reductase
MRIRQEVYKCDICGNIVEVLHGGKGALVCCGKPMAHFEENSVDAAKEKHVPVGVPAQDGLTVKVGAVPHPMEDAHYIEWIEVKDGDRIKRQYLKPGEAPEASFCAGSDGAVLRAFCNLHGLWKG